MGGILKNLQKKNQRTTSIAAEILVRRRAQKVESEVHSQPEDPHSTETILRQADGNLGDPTKLLAELKAESRAIVDRSKTSEKLEVRKGFRRSKVHGATTLKLSNKARKPGWSV